MISKLALSLLVAFGLIATASAKSCLSEPFSVGSGGGCGGPLSCHEGLFCHPRTAKCTPTLKAGDSCKDLESVNGICGDNAECRSSSIYSICVPYVHPGQDCSSSSSSLSVGDCGSGACVNNVCKGGMMGDSCSFDSDCIANMTCTKNVCKGLGAGSLCQTSAVCLPGLYCDSNSGTCISQKTSGTCTSSDQCLYGYGCMQTNSSAVEFTCVEYESLTPGQYCASDLYCKDSLRCSQGYCAKNRVKYCDQDIQCSADERCACDSTTRQSSNYLGVCTKSSCFSVHNKLNDCINKNCRSAGPTFKGSCIDNSCLGLYNSYRACSPASQLIVSFFSVSLMGLLAFFSSRYL